MKSMMALSMHKAGSTVANYIFVEILKEKGYDIDEISKRVMGSPLPEHEVYSQYESKISLENMYYGIARSPRAQTMDVLKKIRLVVQVRDPRDCITSQYFSLAASHIVPEDAEKKKKFLAERQRASATPIDKFAIEAVGGYVNRLETLKGILETHEDILLLKYEDMVEDSQKWLDDFSTFVDQPITPDINDRIKKLLNFNVPYEDASRHKRQVKPGDHKRKLSQETISSMNDKLSDLLNTFGYEV